MVNVRHRVAVTAALGLFIGCTTLSDGPEGAAEPRAPEPAPSAAASADEAPDLEPTEYAAGEGKPLSRHVERGLKWLVAHQLKSGAWGQGDESQNMGGSMAQLATVGNVADTAMAVLALTRSGSTPSQGTYARASLRGVEFILAEVEESDDESLKITDVEGTRVQGKIGLYADTFVALVALTEVDGKMPTKAGNARVDEALTKILAKIERNQREDGSFDDRGWAPALSQSMASKGLNKAARGGKKVKKDVLARAEKRAKRDYKKGSRSFSGDGAAGIELYSGATQASAMRESAETRKQRSKKLERKLAKAGKDEARAIKAEIAAADEAQATAESMEDLLIDRLADDGFVQGFGNNGGEEFLSYLLVSETLVTEGGKKWEKWDQSITRLLSGVQNDDGSWTGHHCITGRTFCTATALLVLMADRAPAPVGTKLHG
jgi:hypothetical protein